MEKSNKLLGQPNKYEQNQSILKEINPEYALEGLMLKVNTWWPPDSKSQLIGKDPDARKAWGQEEKGTTEDEMVGWHHQLNGHEFEQTSGDSEGQGSLASYSPWGHRAELDLVTERQQQQNLKYKKSSWRRP